MMLLAQALIYTAALVGVAASSIGMLYWFGRALNKARPNSVRWRSWTFAALCLCGIVASAALGFVGLGAIMYFAQQ